MSVSLEKIKKIEKLIKKAKNILILTHKAPDGDAISSSLALYFYLRKKGKTPYLYLIQLPKFLSFLPFFEKISSKPPKNDDFDLIFALDYAETHRLALWEGFTLKEERLITIDHHPIEKLIGKIKLADSTASSTCEVLYFWFKKRKFKISSKLATLLLCGIYTDSVAFSRLSTSKRKIIGELILKGGEIERISKAYSSIALSRAKLLATMIKRIKEIKPYGIIYSWLSKEDFKKEKEKIFLQDPPVFPDFLSQIGEAKIYVLLIQQGREKVKVSLRGQDPRIDLSKIAEEFGGGGHPLASGFKTEGKISEIWEILQERLKKALINLKK